MEKWRRIAIVSCTHFGSNTALAPPEYTAKDGTVYKANKTQRHIWDCWQTFLHGKAKDADLVVHLGDAIQGSNRKSFGAGASIVDLDDQKLMAVQVLQELKQNRRMLMMRGSNYHNSLDTDAERDIAAALGAEFGGSLIHKRLKGTDTVMLFGHGKSSPAMYKGSFEDRESLLLDAAYGSGQMQERIDIVCKGHWHTFLYLDFGHRLMLRVPGWQYWYEADFMLDMLGKKQNFIGGVVLDVGPKDAMGKVQTHVHKDYLWPQNLWTYEAA